MKKYSKPANVLVSAILILTLIYPSGLFAFPVPEQDLQQMEQKSFNYISNIKTNHWEPNQNQILHFLGNGQYEGFKDAAIYSGLFLASEAFRFRATGDEAAYKNVEEGLMTLHHLQKVSGTPGVLSRFVLPDGEPLIPNTGSFASKDTYTGVIFGYYAAYSILKEGPLKELVRQDVQQLMGNFIRNDHVFKGVNNAFLSLKPHFGFSSLEHIIETDKENIQLFVDRIHDLRTDTTRIPTGAFDINFELEWNCLGGSGSLEHVRALGLFDEINRVIDDISDGIDDVLDEVDGIIDDITGVIGNPRDHINNIINEITQGLDDWVNEIGGVFTYFRECIGIGIEIEPEYIEVPTVNTILIAIGFLSNSLRKTANVWSDLNHEKWTCCQGPQICGTELYNECISLRENFTPEEFRSIADLLDAAEEIVGAPVWKHGAVDSPERIRMNVFFNDLMAEHEGEQDYARVFRKHWDRGVTDYLNLILDLVHTVPSALSSLVKYKQWEYDVGITGRTVGEWFEKSLGLSPENVALIERWIENNERNEQILNDALGVLPQSISRPEDINILGSEALLGLHVLKVGHYITGDQDVADQYETSFANFMPTIKDTIDIQDDLLTETLGDDIADAARIGGTHLLKWLAIFALIDLEEDPNKAVEYREVLGSLYSYTNDELNSFYNFVHFIQAESSERELNRLEEGIESLIAFPPYGNQEFIYSDEEAEEFGGLIQFLELKGTRNPISLDRRPRDPMIWQRSPRRLLNGFPGRIFSGVDYQLAYWMGRAYGLFDNNASQIPNIDLAINDTWVRNLNPEIMWEVPEDREGDNLHFKLEISTATDFSGDVLVYSSSISSAGFNPAPPVPSNSGAAQFEIPGGGLLESPDFYHVRVRTFDGEYMSPASQVVSFGVDQTSPTISISQNQIAFSPLLSQAYIGNILVEEYHSGISIPIRIGFVNSVGEVVQPFSEVNLRAWGVFRGATNISWPWNGDILGGQVAPDGDYFLVVESTDVAGNRTIIQSDPIIVDSTPPVFSSGTITVLPSNQGESHRISVDVFENKTSSLTVSMVINGPGIFQTSWQFDIPHGQNFTHTFNWNGKNNFNVDMPEGVYAVSVFGIDGVGNKSEPYDMGSLIVDRTPTLFNVLYVDKPIFLPQNGESITLNYDLSEFSIVSISIENSMGQSIAQENIGGQNPGIVYQYSWDGIIGGEISTDGRYFFRITAQDDQGNSPMVQTIPFILNNVPVSIQFPQAFGAPALVDNHLVVRGTTLDPTISNTSDFSWYKVWIRQGANIDFSHPENNPINPSTAVWISVPVPAFYQRTDDLAYPTSNVSYRPISNSILGVLDSATLISGMPYTIMITSKDEGDQFSFDSIEVIRNPGMDQTTPLVDILRPQSAETIMFDQFNDSMPIEYSLSHGGSSISDVIIQIHKLENEGAQWGPIVFNKYYEKIDTPPILNWDGRGFDFKFVDNGAYRIYVQVIDGDGMGVGETWKDFNVSIPIDQPLTVNVFEYANPTGAIIPVGSAYDLEYELSKEGQVTVEVYDDQNNLVQTLQNAVFAAGNIRHSLTGQIDQGGLYTIRLNAISVDETQAQVSADLHLAVNNNGEGTGNISLDTPPNVLDGIQGEPLFQWAAQVEGERYPPQDFTAQVYAFGSEIVTQSLGELHVIDTDWSDGNYTLANNVVANQDISLSPVLLGGVPHYSFGIFISEPFGSLQEDITEWGRVFVSEEKPGNSNIRYFIETWDGFGAWQSHETAPGLIINAPLGTQLFRWKVELIPTSDGLQTPVIHELEISYHAQQENQVDFQTSNQPLTGTCWNTNFVRLPISPLDEPLDLSTLFPELSSKNIVGFPFYRVDSISNPNVSAIIYQPSIDLKQLEFFTSVTVPWSSDEDINLSNGKIGSAPTYYNDQSNRFDFKLSSGPVPISPFYPANIDMNVSLEERSMYTFWRDGANELISNPLLNINVNTWDYELSYPDGSTLHTLNSNLSLPNNQAQDSEFNLLLNSTEIPRVFIPIKGNTTPQGSFESYALFYRPVGQDVWKSIGTSTEPVETSDFMGYWDVTGLNGDFDVRLVVMDASGLIEEIKRFRVGSLVRRQDITTTPLIYVVAPFSKGFLEFSPLALVDDANVTMTPVSLQNISQDQSFPTPIGSLYRFQPDGIEFVKNIDDQVEYPGTLTVRYTYEELQGVDLGNLTVYRLKEDGSLIPFGTPSGRFLNDSGTPGVMDPGDIYEVSNLVTGFSSYLFSDDSGIQPPTLTNVMASGGWDQVTVHGQSNPFGLVEIYLNNQSQGTIEGDVDGNFSMDIQIAEGQNSIYAEAIKLVLEADIVLRSLSSNVLSIETDSNPIELDIVSVKPAPFNPINVFASSTTVTYQLSRSGRVSAHVFKDESLATTVFSNVQEDVGVHSFVWDGKNDLGSPFGVGEYEIRFDVVDSLGFSIEKSTSVFIINDTTPPESMVVSSQQMYFDGQKNRVGPGVQVGFEANDGISNVSGVERIEYEIDGSGFISYESPISFNGEGDYMLRHRAVDRFGNWEDEKSFLLHVDKTDPTVLSLFSEPEFINEGRVFFSPIFSEPLRIIDGRLDVEIFIDGVPLQYDDVNSMWYLDVTQDNGSSDISKMAVIKARDLVGNEGLSINSTFFIDRTPPEVIMETEQFLDVFDSVVIQFTDNGAWDLKDSHYVMTRNGLPYNNFVIEVQGSSMVGSLRNLNPSDAVYEIFIQAQDEAGNVSEQTIITVYDLLSPIQDLIAEKSAQIRLNWTAPASTQSYELRFSTFPITSKATFNQATLYSDSLNWTPQNGGSNEEKTLTGFIPGNQYYFGLVYYDSFGNMGFSFNEGVTAALAGEYQENTELGLPVNPGLISEWGDYDGDGDYDLLRNGSIFENQNGDSLNELFGLPFSLADWSSAAWADYDNDNDLDVIAFSKTAGDSGVKFYQNNNGIFSSDNRQPQFVGLSGNIALGDIDNDGDLDLILSAQICPGSCALNTVYKNNGGIFQDVPFFDLHGSVIYQMFLYDIDEDGDVDIIRTPEKPFNGSLEIFINNLSGFSLNQSLPASNGELIIGEFGWSDGVALIHISDLGFRIYEPNQNGLFGSSAYFNLPFDVSSSALGDLDNDGDFDIVISGRNLTSGQLETAVFSNNSGNFENIHVLIHEEYESMTLSDFDNDGDLDLATPNRIFESVTAENEDPNSPPSPPGNVSISMGSDEVVLTWDRAVDQESSEYDLNYQVRMGTSSGGGNIISGVYGGPLLGNMLRKKISPHEYGVRVAYALENPVYASVRSIDSNLAVSDWTVEIIYPENTPPIINPISDMVIESSQSFIMPLFANDLDGDELVWEFINFPEDIVFIQSSTTSYYGTLTWNPSDDDIGQYGNLSISVSDGIENYFSNEFSITIEPKNIIPQAVIGSNKSFVDSDGNGFESIILDGSNSQDVDGTVVEYLWWDEAVGFLYVGSEVTPVVDLSGGTHIIAHAVKDNKGKWSALDIATYTVFGVLSADAGQDQTVVDTRGDGIISGRDYVVLQRNFGRSVGDEGWSACLDANGDGTIGTADYTVWSDNFGSSASNPPWDGRADIDDCLKETIQLNATQSVLDGNPPYQYLWKEGTKVLYVGEDPRPRVVLHGLGVHHLELTLTNGNGISRVDNVQIQIDPWESINQIPVAHAGTDQIIIDTRGDGVISGSDYMTLQRNLGSTDSCPDMNGDGIVNSSDSTIWSHHYGLTDSDSNWDDRADINGCFTETVTVDASHSTLHGNPPFQYQWRENGNILHAGGNPQADVVLNGLGNHVLELTLMNGNGLFSSDTVQVRLDPWDLGVNAAPIVSLNVPEDIEVATRRPISAHVQDDGQPYGNTLSTRWEVISSPGEVIFDNPNAARTMVQFVSAGDHIIQFSADDGDKKTIENIRLDVKSPIRRGRRRVSRKTKRDIEIPYYVNSPGPVSITITDTLGNELREIRYEYRNTGSHIAYWDRRNRQNSLVASGIYYANIQTGENIERRKLVVIR